MNSKIKLTNYFFRFLSEILALISIGFWGWKLFDKPLNYIVAIFLPIIFALLWGVFNVPGDPSRSGKAPVKVPGFVRMFIEIAFFGFAVWTLYNVGYKLGAFIFLILLIIHYLISYDRVRWLFDQR